MNRAAARRRIRFKSLAAALENTMKQFFSFNDDDVWTANGTSRKGGASQVRLWRELLEKLARESRM